MTREADDSAGGQHAGLMARVPGRERAYSHVLHVLFQNLWERRRWLLRVTAIGVVIALVIAFSLRKQYQSTVRLMPPDPQSLSSTSMLAAMGGVGAGGATSLASSLLGMKTPGALFVGVLSSRTAQDDLINRFDLRRVYRTKEYGDAREVLTRRTGVFEDKKSGIITITVTDNDAQRAQALANAYVLELDKLVSQLSTSSAHRERVFLEGRLKAVKQDLDDATLAMSRFSSRNATLDVQAQSKAMVDAVAKLQGELIAAQGELRGLESSYTDNNIRVVTVRARIGELRRQLQKMGGVGENTDSSDLKPDQLYPSIRKLPMLGATYFDLYRRTKVQETVYEILTKQYELVKVQEAKEIPSVTVLDAADLPEQKSFPPRLFIIVLGAVIAFTCGAARVCGAVWWAELDTDGESRRFVGKVLLDMNSSPIIGQVIRLLRIESPRS